PSRTPGRPAGGLPRRPVHPARRAVRPRTPPRPHGHTQRRHRVHRRGPVPVLPVAKGRALIELTDLTKSYGSTKVLREVSLSIERGGVTSIIGPNGAGKSTLLTIVGRLLKADGGRVTVDELDVSRA